MPAVRTAISARPPSARSAISSASALLPGVDQRSALARRYREICEALTADIGGDLTEAERLTVRSAAALAIRAEVLQAAIVRGEDVSPDDAVRLANASARLLAVLKRGRQHRPAPAPPTLAEYVAAKRLAEAAPA
jgi:hypothetical protein